jgi:hypothetical protein
VELLPDYPDIKVEIVINYGLTDIVAERYDAGMRSGEMVLGTDHRGGNRCPRAEPHARPRTPEYVRIA